MFCYSSVILLAPVQYIAMSYNSTTVIDQPVDSCVLPLGSLVSPVSPWFLLSNGRNPLHLRLAARFVTLTRYPSLVPQVSPYVHRLITGRNVRRLFLSRLVPPMHSSFSAMHAHYINQILYIVFKL